MHKAKRLPVLDHAQAIETEALGRPKIFRAENVIRAAGGDEDRLAAVRHLALVVLELRHTDQIGADSRGREQPGHEFDIEIVALAQRRVEPGIRRACLGQRRRNLARGQAPPHHRTLGEQLVKGLGAAAFDFEGRNSHGSQRNARAQYQPGRG